MSSHRLAQLVLYLRRVFGLHRLARGLTDTRSHPKIPTAAVWWCLFLGALTKVPSFLQLQAETARRVWQRWMEYPAALSDDVLDYVSERFDLEGLRQVLVQTNTTLKRNKVFEPFKIAGLLVVSLDGNEQFKSRCRCCEACLERQIKVQDAQGREQVVTEYYHHQVYAQLSGPSFSVLLDLESVRRGEEEAGAVLRLLGRLRECYGVRFFDVVVLDAWFAKGPLLKAIEALGWEFVVVLKQEAYEVAQETVALTQGQPAQESFHLHQPDRQVDLWSVADLRFSDTYPGPVRVVQSQETSTKVEQRGRQRQRVTKEQRWRWVVSDGLAGYAARVIWQIGHQRWKIENHAFNELTQHWHLEHCAHHEPRAILACLLILLLAFNLLHVFAIVHGKLFREGRITLQELRQQIYRALELPSPLLFFSG